MAYLYIVNATGVFAGSSITSRTNLKSLVALTTLSGTGVSISSYQHNHGKITALTSTTDTAADRGRLHWTLVQTLRQTTDTLEKLYILLMVEKLSGGR